MIHASSLRNRSLIKSRHLLYPAAAYILNSEYYAGSKAPNTFIIAVVCQ